MCKRFECSWWGTDGEEGQGDGDELDLEDYMNDLNDDDEEVV